MAASDSLGSASKSSPSGDTAATERRGRFGMDTTALFLVLGSAAAIVTVSFAVGVTPEVYVAPIGKPFVLAALGLGLVWSLCLPALPPVRALPLRRWAYYAGVAVSVVAFWWALDIATGVGGRVGGVSAGDVSLWAGVALLFTANALATASRRRRKQLLVWLIATVLAFALMFCVVLRTGIGGFGMA